MSPYEVLVNGKSDSTGHGLSSGLNRYDRLRARKPNARIEVRDSNGLIIQLFTPDGMVPASPGLTFHRCARIEYRRRHGASRFRLPFLRGASS